MEDTNKHIYFDPLIKKVPTPKSSSETEKLEVSLQGRRMVGCERSLPDGYKGLVFARHEPEIEEEVQRLRLDQINCFNKVTEWQKDEW